MIHSQLQKISNKIESAFIAELKHLKLHALLKLSRKYLIGRRRFLGNLYIPLISEILEVEDEKIIQEIGVSSLFGRAFVIIQDQMLDNLKKPNPKYITIAPILLYEFTKRINKSSNNVLDEEMQTILLKAMQANVDENIKHRDNIASYSQNDLKNLGTKTGLIRIPVYAMCHIAKKINLYNNLSRITENILVAIQIADDICDIEEDFSDGNYTIPITQGFLFSGEKKLSLDNVYKGLLLSGLFELLINYSLDLLNLAQKNTTKITSKTHTESFLTGLIGNITKVKKEILKLKQTEGLPMLLPNNFNECLLLKKTGKNGADIKQFIPFLKQFEPGKIQNDLL